MFSGGIERVSGMEWVTVRRLLNIVIHKITQMIFHCLDVGRKFLSLIYPYVY